MVKKPLNRNRKALGMPPIKDQAEHAPATAFNFLAYSKYLGTVDNAWKYRWDIGGYLFNDLLPSNREELERLVNFVQKDKRPTIFFSLGSCNSPQGGFFAGRLFDICCEHDYKLLVASGWFDVGAALEKKDNLFRLESFIPHSLVFPHCDAIIHHGGVGTTHNAARSRKPQMTVPLLLDQFYWSQRIKDLGIGPGGVKIKKISKKLLERNVVDLVTNPAYKEKAESLGILIRNEMALENICNHIESYGTQDIPDEKGA